MTSDDTEHLFLTGQALLASAGDVPRFERSLSWRLRGWLAALPAGVGLATLRATIKLWIGLILPIRSGVRSAGNGATMRSAVIGAFAAHDPALRRALCDTSSRLTHTDPRAVVAARAVAEIRLEVREKRRSTRRERVVELLGAPGRAAAGVGPRADSSSRRRGRRTRGEPPRSSGIRHGLCPSVCPWRSAQLAPPRRLRGKLVSGGLGGATPHDRRVRRSPRRSDLRRRGIPVPGSTDCKVARGHGA
jgi:hypothetical protein